MKLFKNLELMKKTATLAMLTISAFIALHLHAEPILDIASSPLSSSGPVVIKPNMLYVLDDSGSMNRDFMPDWVGIVPGTTTTTWNKYNAYLDDPSLNTLAYDPAVTYEPPVYFTSAGLDDTTTYPSQTGTSFPRGARTSNSMPNWQRVANDAYGSFSGTSNLEGSASYTLSIANEYCTNVDLKVCIKANLPTEAYPYPAPLRWCRTQAVAQAEALPPAGECQGVRIEGDFDEERFPVNPPTSVTTYRATVRIDQVYSRPGVAGITVNGQQIMSGSTGTSWNRGALARASRDNINDCSSAATGNCTVAGYEASTSGRTITIVSTNPADLGVRPQLNDYSGTVQYSTTPFVNAGTSTVSTLNRVTVNIISGNTYPYPDGSGAKHPNRTDCLNLAGCTYEEEMTNYANWYTYYRTRIQMMKTSTSIAFKNVGDDFRMGFMTINANGASKARDFRDFSNADKKAWYDKLFSIIPNGGTPLREALGKAGRIYADKYSLSGTFNDPVQYECQQNFTLLTTDGLWNGNNGRTVNNGTIPNLDNVASEKGKYEGNTAVRNQLADVAKYYRDTDLRTGAFGNCTGALGSNVCETTGVTGLNQKQSMVTFTLGLGVDGTLAYDIDYGPSAPGDFKRIYDGTLNWPEATANSPETIDDLWHTAVNGDGRYFSAKKTTELVDQLRDAIALIKVKTGAGAAAATSTLNPVSGDNFAYIASYTSGLWTGNLEKREIDLVTGEINKAAIACVEDVVPEENCSSPSTIQPDGAGGYSCVTTGVTDPTACAGTLVGTECRTAILPTCTGELKNQILAGPRTIYMNNSGVLTTFDFANLNANQAINFSNNFLLANLTQGSSYTSNQALNVDGDKLVNYLKGDITYEEDAPLIDNKLFRKRTAVLGDLIDSKPSFIGKPTFNYGDPGYQTFRTSNATRKGVVYVGSNDGMLHAFDADTLEEKWAFVPSAVIPNLWKLADSNYSSKHTYYVNGDLTISDVCVALDCSTATAADWRTILVAGLDAGGRGYYALDITNPSAPQLLWEIDPNSTGFHNLGYSYGNPIITKRNGDDRWVVVFTSGYNNIRDDNNFYNTSASTGVKPTITSQLQYHSGNGRGYLYVVDVRNGNLLQTIGTNVGSTTSPSGLGKISAFADNAEVDNLTTYIYGGDLDGNIWRFNITASASFVLHFARLRDASGVVQPVMTPPELGEINNRKVIFVGTGKYLEATDLDQSGFTTQSLYALKDEANDTDPGPVYNNARSVVGVVNQTVVPNPDKPDERISGTNTGVDLTTDLGWFLDFPDNGERQNVASQLVLGTLLVPTTVPTASACQPAGYGWFNYFDYRTGLSVINPFGAVSERTAAPSVGFNVVYIDGKPKVSNVLSDDPNPKLMDGVQFNAIPSGFQMRRSIWRELQ